MRCSICHKSISKSAEYGRTVCHECVNKKVNRVSEKLRQIIFYSIILKVVLIGIVIMYMIYTGEQVFLGIVLCISIFTVDFFEFIFLRVLSEILQLLEDIKNK